MNKHTSEDHACRFGVEASLEAPDRALLIGAVAGLAQHPIPTARARCRQSTTVVPPIDKTRRDLAARHAGRRQPQHIAGFCTWVISFGQPVRIMLVGFRNGDDLVDTPRPQRERITCFQNSGSPAGDGGGM